jgi:hypothetical protein
MRNKHPGTLKVSVALRLTGLCSSLPQVPIASSILYQPLRLSNLQRTDKQLQIGPLTIKNEIDQAKHVTKQQLEDAIRNFQLRLEILPEAKALANGGKYISFRPFPQLPIDLRQMAWKEALPMEQEVPFECSRVRGGLIHKWHFQPSPLRSTSKNPAMRHCLRTQLAFNILD